MFALRTIPCMAQEQTSNQYISFSLEELSNLDITSVTGIEEDWFRSPAAVYVITQEDIQRTGHESIADILRMVPGVNVAQISSSAWIVGTRGIQAHFTDSMLLLVDGRSVYDPKQSVLFWDTQDMILDDIQQIEASRGPGSTLWGSNALNGVVSLTTKSAKDTQGWLFKVKTGTQEKPVVSLRYGDQINDNTHFRVWTKYANHGASKSADGSDAQDNWDMFRTGFRLDVEAPNTLDWTVQGSFYHTDHMGDTIQTPDPTASFSSFLKTSNIRISTGNLQATIQKQTNDNNRWTFRTSLDRTIRSTANGFESQRDILEADYRQRVAINDNSLIIWGTSYKLTADKTESSTALEYIPQDETVHLFSCFVQSTTQYFDDKVSMVLGCKFEHNDYTGFEYHPSARLSWAVNDINTFWASISRPVRNPGRTNTAARITPFFADTGLLGNGPPSGILIPVTVGGNDDLESETMSSYELGYRSHLGRKFTVDIATYFNKYQQLITNSIANPGELNNHLNGEIYGIETSLVWTPAPTLRLEAGYALNRSTLHGDSDSNHEESYPINQFHFRTYLDIGKDIELNTALYFVDQRQTEEEKSYLKLDLGLTWRLSEKIELSLWGKNLLDSQQVEYYDTNRHVAPYEIPQNFSVSVKMTF